MTAQPIILIRRDPEPASSTDNAGLVVMREWPARGTGKSTRTVVLKEWDDSDHPRDEHGRFADSAGVSSGGQPSQNDRSQNASTATAHPVPAASDFHVPPEGASRDEVARIGQANADLINRSTDPRAAAQAYAQAAMSNLSPELQQQAQNVASRMSSQQVTVTDASGRSRTINTQDTATLYDTPLGSDHRYTDERQALHDQLVQGVLDQAAAQGIPQDRQALMLGGLGGAGKTSSLSSPEVGGFADTSKYMSVNPDDFKEALIRANAGVDSEHGIGLMAVEGLAPMETSPLLHDESSDIARQAASALQDHGYNMTWDITMASQGSVQSRLDGLSGNSYTTKGIFVDVPVNTSIDRALGRYSHGATSYEDGSGFGGRFVPPSLIAGNVDPTGEYNSQNARTFQTLADTGAFGGGWIKIDNSGTAPRVVGRG